MNFESEADEMVLIAAVISLTNSDPGLVDRLNPEHFSGARAEVWRLATELHAEGKPVTPRAIEARSRNMSVANTIKQVRGQVFPAGRVWSAESTIRELANYRRLQGAITAISERLQASESYSEALESAHAELARLEQSQVPAAVRPFSAVWDDWLERVKTPEKYTPPIPTPWEPLNDKLGGGLRRGRTYVIGGRPGEGKSIAGANLASYAAEHGHKALVFSVEMGEAEVANRIIAAGAQAEFGQIDRNKIDAYNMERIAEYGDTNRTMPLFIVDKTDIGVEYISSICRTMKRNNGVDVVFVDYLQILKQSDTKVVRERQIAEMSRGLKILSRELDCAVIIACQLNRNSANEKRAPILADLRESGSIEQDCDVAILLHHKADESGPTGDLDLIVAKNRNGTTGPVTARWKSYQARIA